MLRDIQIKNFGPLGDLEWSSPSPQINVILGENSSGKTFLLKSLYAAVRTLEEFGKGQDNRGAKQVLDDKLYWTFQPERIGDLVTKGARERLSFSASVDGKRIAFEFSPSAEKGVGNYTIPDQTRNSVSLFLPAKEILSLFHVIKKSRGIDKEFGFDDTYYDLVKAVEKAPTQGRVGDSFSVARRTIEGLITGRVEYENNRWLFRLGNQVYSINVTAEGYKRIAIIDRLIVNRTLSQSSILFFDEPDAMLHPTAVVSILKALGAMAAAGMQIFLATHSIFALKQLYIMAKSRDVAVSVLSLENGDASICDLAQGIPDTKIISTSIALFIAEQKVRG